MSATPVTGCSLHPSLSHCHEPASIRARARTKKCLARNLHDALLADYHDLDLPWVIQVFLYTLCHVASHAQRSQIIHFVRFDRDTELAAGLDSEAPLHAGEAVGDLFKRLQA